MSERFGFDPDPLAEVERLRAENAYLRRQLTQPPRARYIAGRFIAQSGDHIQRQIERPCRRFDKASMD